MANSAAICTSFKRELLCGHHAFGTAVIRAATTKDTLKAAAYSTAATMNAGTTAHTAVNEVAGAGYVAGGVVVTNAVDPAQSGTSAYWTPSASIVFAGVSIGPTDAILLYNSTQANKAVAVITFSAATVVAGTLTLTMPVNAAGTALLNIV